MSNGLSIVLIGAGNVAWHLGQAFEQAGHTIKTVYSRKLENAESLARQLKQANPTQSLNFMASPADLYVIAVKDDAVLEVVKEAVFPENSLVVHTSGSLPLSILTWQPHIRPGIFYPIQTFSKSVVIDLKSTPIGIEANTTSDTVFLESLAKTVSNSVVVLPSEARKILHLAAVFACNFSNFLLGISHDLLTPYQLEFSYLQPLVTETIQKAFRHHPFQVQTGPAVRFDENTIAHHRTLLENNPDYLAVYNLLTAKIQQKANEISGLPLK